MRFSHTESKKNHIWLRGKTPPVLHATATPAATQIPKHPKCLSAASQTPLTDLLTSTVWYQHEGFEPSIPPVLSFHPFWGVHLLPLLCPPLAESWVQDWAGRKHRESFPASLINTAKSRRLEILSCQGLGWGLEDS